MKPTPLLSFSLALAVAAVIGRPGPSPAQDWVQTALDSDPRNAAFEITARLEIEDETKTLTLNLDSVDVSKTAPADLWRAVFQIAEAAALAELAFDKVILARDDTPVFYLEGDDFLEMGRERNRGQNPVYQLRTLPEKLYRPQGERAFENRTGGLIVVTGKQMEDLTQASLAWIDSSPGGPKLVEDPESGVPVDREALLRTLLSNALTSEGDVFFIPGYDELEEEDRSQVVSLAEDVTGAYDFAALRWVCRGDDLRVYVQTPEYLSNDAIRVRWKLDNEEPNSSRWGPSTDGAAAFVRNPVRFTNTVIEGRQVIIRVWNYRGTAYTYTFPVSGLRSALGNLRCIEWAS